METSIKRIRSPEPQLASKDVWIASKAVQVDSLEGRHRIEEECALQISDNISKHVSQSHAAEAGRSSSKVALDEIESQPQVFCAPESSLREEVGGLQLDRTFFDEQYELEARHDGCTCYLLSSACDTNRIFCENILELRAQYGQELADPCDEHKGLQARLSTYDSSSRTSYQYFSVALAQSEACRSASLSSHLRLES